MKLRVTIMRKRVQGRKIIVIILLDSSDKMT